MENKIRRAFDEITADEQLKADTLRHIMQHQEHPRKRRSFPKYIAAAACLLFFVVTAGFSYRIYFTPASYVDIDVNPSVELVMNRFGAVIEASAYNTDGEEILSSLKLKYKSCRDALTLLIDAMNTEGYIAADGLLSVTVQAREKEQELLDSVQQNVNSILSAQQITLEQDIFIVDAETKTHSHDLHVSPAKYLAISELQEVDPSATVEECQNHSISELKEYTRQHRHQTGSSESDETDETDSSTRENDTHHNDTPAESNTDHNNSGNGHQNQKQHNKKH